MNKILKTESGRLTVGACLALAMLAGIMLGIVHGLKGVDLPQPIDLSVANQLKKTFVIGANAQGKGGIVMTYDPNTGILTVDGSAIASSNSLAILTSPNTWTGSTNDFTGSKVQVGRGVNPADAMSFGQGLNTNSAIPDRQLSANIPLLNAPTNGFTGLLTVPNANVANTLTTTLLIAQTVTTTNMYNTNLGVINSGWTNTVTTSPLTGNWTCTLPNANSNPVQPLGGQAAHQTVGWVDSAGVQHTVQLGFSDILGSATSAQLPGDVGYTDRNQTWSSNNTFNLKPVLVSGLTLSNANGSAYLFIDAGTGFPQFSTGLEANGFIGDGSTLTGINFSQLAGKATYAQAPTGTATNIVGAGGATVSFNGGTYTVTQGAATMPSYLVLTNGVYTNTVTTAPLTGNWTCTLPNANSNPVQPSSAPANQFANGVSGAGAFSYAQPSFGGLSGSWNLSQAPAGTQTNFVFLPNWLTVTQSGGTTTLNTNGNQIAAGNIPNLSGLNGSLADSQVSPNTSTNYAGAGGATVTFANHLLTVTQGAGTSYASSPVSTNASGTATYTPNTWSTVFTLTTTATTGCVDVVCQVLTPASFAGNGWLRIHDATMSRVASQGYVGMGSGNPPYQCVLPDFLTGSAKTYTAEWSSSSGIALTNYGPNAAGAGQSLTNALWMQINQHP